MSGKLKDAEDWDGVAVKQAPDLKKRLAELKAKAPTKRKKTSPFAKAYLNPAARAFAALNCSKAMVWLWLVHRAWKRQCLTHLMHAKHELKANFCETRSSVSARVSSAD
jgi:hypothetical protein